MASATTAHQVRRVIKAQEAQGEISREEAVTLDETKVYIGLNDMETKEQKLETERYITILKKICRQCGVPFSFDVVEGGYIHDDGEFTEERSIVLTFIDVPEEKVDEVARESCVLFHQESVLVTIDHIEARSVREAL